MSGLSHQPNLHNAALATAGPVRLLSEDGDLFEAVPAPLRQDALRECLAPTMLVSRGEWQPPQFAGQGGVGLLVLDGLMLRRVGVGGRFGAELLGEGDLLRPWQSEMGALGATTRWRVLTKLRVAILSPGVIDRFRRYPTLADALTVKALARARGLSLMMAIVHHPRVDIRVHMLLWHLADRWGRVRADGVLLPLPLSHNMVAELIAAQRPSVTGALSKLSQEQLIARVPDGWLLGGAPPVELHELQEAAAA